MKKCLKAVLAGLTAAILVVSGVVFIAMPVEVEAADVQLGDLSQSYTETGKLVSPKAYQVSAMDGDVTVTELLVHTGQRVRAGETLMTLAPGALESLLSSQMEQLNQRKAALEAQKRMTQAQRTAALEQAKAQLASVEWEYNMLFHEEWGVADKLTDEALESKIQARYAWLDVRDSDDGELTTQRSVGALHSQYRQASAGLAVANAQYSEHAKSYYQALVDYQTKLVAAMEGDTGAVVAANASIAELDAMAALLQSKLDGIAIAAPFDGVITQLNVGAGQAVGAGVPLAIVTPEKDLEVELLLLAADAMKLNQGDRVQCTLEGGYPFQGEITFVAAAAQEVVSTVGIRENRCMVRIRPEQLPDGAGVGFGVDASFQVPVSLDTKAVKLSSVIRDKDAAYLYVVMDNRAQKVMVQTGQTAGSYLEIIEGLQGNETVIGNPTEAGVRDGSRVKVVA